MTTAKSRLSQTSAHPVTFKSFVNMSVAMSKATTTLQKDLHVENLFDSLTAITHKAKLQSVKASIAKPSVIIMVGVSKRDIMCITVSCDS